MEFCRLIIFFAVSDCLLCVHFVSSLKNLALGRPTWEQFPWIKPKKNWGSKNAVDGSYNDRGASGNQCTISDNYRKTAEWRVDLGDIVSISHIDIYYRTDNFQMPTSYTSRIAGFFLYVSNTTSKYGSHLCFHEIQTVNRTPSENQRIQCSTRGRFVIFYNERKQGVKYPSYYSSYAYNELCEVEVYGCSRQGFYGDNCTLRCPSNCRETQCNLITGHCTSCVPGYYGFSCNRVCDYKAYGQDCSLRCGNCSNGETCQHVNGSCLHGCDAGVSGEQCNDECLPGFFGKDCLNKCSENCMNSASCDRFTGHCNGGCKPGWTGNKCDQMCAKNFYGPRCALICGSCRNKETCHNIDGTCPHGCDDGVYGEKCQRECMLGNYGKNCIYKCNTQCIVSNQCNRVTGHCNGGCKQGWAGNMCDQECHAGLYGKDCKNQCSVNCNVTNRCDRFTGECNGGCKPGWIGTACNFTCAHTFFGANCTQQCDTACKNHECDYETGECFAIKQTDEQTNISIIGGSIAAVIALLVLIFVIILYKRTRGVPRQGRYKADDIGNTTDPSSFSNAAQDISNIYQNYTTEDPDIKDLTTLKKPPVRRHEQLDKENNSRELKDDDFDIDEKIHEENPYGDFYMNDDIHTPDIAAIKLEDVIREKSKNKDDGFKKEYATLFYGERYSCESGKLPENLTKNRFKTTFPYDHSRVFLANRRADYINANYIDGIRAANIYIATQGPRQNTVADFWFMVWQENIKQIVMLTNLMEGTKAKCVQYWPDIDQNIHIDMFLLETTEERLYAFYCIRKVKLSNKKQNKSRTITQYHYTAWPDHGIPDPICLSLFHNHVTRTRPEKHKVPTLVHCSAGIGRTGTYIAIDALHNEHKFNIAEYVKKMREKRMNMVQTYEQYKTIFLTLREMFKSPVSVQTTTEFLRIKQMAEREKLVNASSLKKEFQRLLSVRHHYTKKDYEKASQYREISSIRPLDKYIIYLTSSVKNRGNYINAITLPSFTDQDAYIVTHYPKPGDAIDFLRLITDHESEVVVCMEPLKKEKLADEWLPATRNPKVVTPFTIQLRNEQTSEIQCRKIQITKEGIGDTACLVHMAEPVFNLSPIDSRTVSQILGLVLFAKNVETEHPITVISNDGATLCGVFCAVYNLIQQLTMDEEIDVFSVVRLLQTRRPELCSSIEEYTLIHDALRSFIESRKDDNIYYNQ